MPTTLPSHPEIYSPRNDEEISSFSDQPNVITNVATVKPKPGVFIDEISQLLVLCTPISFLLIGVSVSPVTG